MKTFKWLAVFGLFISTPSFAQVAPSFTQEFDEQPRLPLNGRLLETIAS